MNAMCKLIFSLKYKEKSVKNACVPLHGVLS